MLQVVLSLVAKRTEVILPCATQTHNGGRRLPAELLSNTSAKIYILIDA